MVYFKEKSTEGLVYGYLIELLKNPVLMNYFPNFSWIPDYYDYADIFIKSILNLPRRGGVIPPLERLSWGYYLLYPPPP